MTNYFASLMPLVTEEAVEAAERAMRHATQPTGDEAVFLVGVRELLERGTVNIDEYHQRIESANSLVGSEREAAKVTVQRNAERVRDSLEALRRVGKLVDVRRKTIKMADLIAALDGTNR